MARPIKLCSRRTLIALGLGQVVSLIITSTGFSSSELSRRGINAPTSQSLLNYVLLAIVFGSLFIYRRKGLRAKWYYYLLLGFVDVEANYLVVKAYQYTSITSVMLLDCWTIPCVLFLTWIFLKTKYKTGQFIGVGVCVAGLVLVVFSDVHASDREGKVYMSYKEVQQATFSIICQQETAFQLLIVLVTVYIKKKEEI